MFCPNCGGQNEANAVQCVNCNHPFTPQQPVAPPPQGYGPYPGYGYPPRQESNIISFKGLLAPSELRIIYLLGAIAIAAWTLFAFFNNLLTVIGTNVSVTFHNVMGAFMAIIVGFVAILVFRLICELIIVLSKKNP